MIGKIEFNDLSVILVGFVGPSDGFHYLRMVGPETAVGAIWAKLSAKDRGKKWPTVNIPKPPSP